MHTHTHTHGNEMDQPDRQSNLVGYSLWGRRESDVTEHMSDTYTHTDMRTHTHTYTHTGMRRINQTDRVTW